MGPDTLSSEAWMRELWGFAIEHGLGEHNFLHDSRVDKIQRVEEFQLSTNAS